MNFAALLVQVGSDHTAAITSDCSSSVLSPEDCYVSMLESAGYDCCSGSVTRAIGWTVLSGLGTVLSGLGRHRTHPGTRPHLRASGYLFVELDPAN